MNLLVAIVTLLVGGSILATGYNAMKEFFGEEVNIPVQEVQAINQYVTSEGITMRIEEAINTKNLQLILLSFTKDDGMPFEENECIGYIRTGLGGAMPRQQNYYLVDGNKKLMYCIQGIRREHTEYQSVTVKAEALISPKDEFIKIDKTLDKIEIGMIIDDRYPEVVFESIKEVANGLEIVTRKYRLPEEKGQDIFTLTRGSVSNLIDTRTGEKYAIYGVGHDLDPSNEDILATSTFKDITIEDPPYLQPEYYFEVIDRVSNGKWELTFDLQNISQG